jgi:N,N'-diacetyllegionaminate synthase
MKQEGTYIIAEIGVNHNGSLRLAKDMIKQLSHIGVDAAKFQISTRGEIYSQDSFKPKYQLKSDGSDSPMEMSDKIRLSYDDHLELHKYCLEQGLDYLCSAFDLKSLRFLEENIDQRFFKIASGEIFSIDMLDFISGCTRPILLSTGMATYDEIGTVLGLLNRQFEKNITILHCVSNYPAPLEDANLNVISELKRRFHCKVGFSDHTIGNVCATTSIALGATVIEKHVTTDKNMLGPDHLASATIEEFEDYVKAIRKVETSLGSKEKIFSDAENEIKQAARKSIVTRRILRPNHIISEDDICYKRPGTGFSPVDREMLIGRKVSCEIEADRVINEKDLECL